MTHPARRVYPRSARVGMAARDFPQNPHALSSTNINLRYGCFDDHRDVMRWVTAWVVQEFHERIVAQLGGAARVREEFRGKKAVPQALNFLPVVTQCRNKGTCVITKLNIFDPLKFAEPDAQTQEFFRALNIAANHKAEHIVRRDK